MRTFLDMPMDHPEREGMVSLLMKCGFLVIPNADSMDTALYYAYRIDVSALDIDFRALHDAGLTIVTIGEFDDFLPRHVNPSGPVFIDIKSRRIVSQYRELASIGSL